ncbi:hypothetical protein ACTFIR_003183 [Dictyostelium discoideum]
MIISLILVILTILKNCYCETSFFVPYKVYDFKSSQPGFNINYTQCKSNSIGNYGLVKQNLNAFYNKPKYCCDDCKFKYIENQNVYDQSFISNENSTKTIIDKFKFYPTYYENGVVIYQIFINSFYPINGKGWNEGGQGNNLFWCMEGHYKFKYNIKKKKTSDYFSFYIGGEYSVFIDGKLVLEFSGTNDPEISIDHKFLNLTNGETYTLDFFSCQRFDEYKPYRYALFKTPFVLECNNIPGVNDDVCPPPPPPSPYCNNMTTCNDDNLCTVDSCPSDLSKLPKNANVTDYCTHTPVKCSNNDNNKCIKSLGCDQLDGICKNEPISCDDGNLCTIDKCNPKIGCTNNSTVCPPDNKCTKSLGCDKSDGICKTEPILCDDGNPCTIDKCDIDIGCTHSPVLCNDPDLCKSFGCDKSTGKCKLFSTRKCPPKKTIGLLGLGFICQLEKCEPTSGDCVTDYSGGFLNHLCIDDITCDKNCCTIDKCDKEIGCTSIQLKCPKLK